MAPSASPRRRSSRASSGGETTGVKRTLGSGSFTYHSTERVGLGTTADYCRCWAARRWPGRCRSLVGVPAVVRAPVFLIAWLQRRPG